VSIKQAFGDATVEQRGDSGSNNRPPAQTAIGFVGLGHMGTAMAANVAATGIQVIAYVRRSEQISKLAALGLKPTTNIANLFDCEVIISMLPDDNRHRSDAVLGFARFRSDQHAQSRWLANAPHQAHRSVN
jgi:phosphoglycerate dehydrogenase-like enzyme